MARWRRLRGARRAARRAVRRQVRRLALLALLALAGCGGSVEDAVDARIALVVPDNIREEGIECAGARPFRHVHAGTPYRIEAGTECRRRGRAPRRRGRERRSFDRLELERIPTVCVMTFDVELPARLRYRLVVEGASRRRSRAPSSGRARRCG